MYCPAFLFIRLYQCTGFRLKGAKKRVETGHKLSEIIDLNKLQEVFDDFNTITDITVSLIDVDGSILASSGSKDLCVKFHMTNPSSNSLCMEEHQQIISRTMEGEKYVICQCSNGLTCMGTPIFIEGVYLATIFAGQFFPKEPDLGYFNEQAERFDFVRDEYIEALGKVPVIPEEKANSILELLSKLGKMISQMGYNRLKKLELYEEDMEPKKRELLMDTQAADEPILRETSTCYSPQPRVTEENLRRAIENNEFAVYYQPLIDVKTGAIDSLEALIRWVDSDGNIISPMEFIPLAEETGLIVPIGDWVLREVCKQNQIWQNKGLMKLRISVNVSPIQLQQKNFVNTVKDILKETGLDPKHLEFEITENTFIKSLYSTIKVVHRLRQIGIKVSLDDFGTGYSSLNYLKRLPISSLKIDKSFIHDLEGSIEEAITGSIILLGHKLKLDVVAEGVETREQYDFLHKQGCDKVQGYYFYKPMPREEMEKILSL